MPRTFRYFEKKRGHRTTGSRLFGNLGEAVFFAVLLLVGCAFVVLGIVKWIVPEWRVNHGFVEAPCRVVEKRIVEVPGEKGPLFRPEVKVEYEVQGVTYSPWSPYDVHGTLLSTQDEAQAAIDRFAKGEVYPCWYDPADPAAAVLVRGYQWWIWPALLIPVSFVAIGIGGLVYTALRLGKSEERRAAAARTVPAPNCSISRRRSTRSFPMFPTAARSPAVPAPVWPIACR